MDIVIEVSELRKVYGETVAVDRVSFTVREGEVFGVIGPNGAGKTTTIECLEGLRKPDQGMLRVLGMDPQVEGIKIREQCGMQLQSSNLPDRMKVWETLDLYSSFYSNPANWKELMAQLGLDEKRNTPFAKLSGGQKQRLFIALALLPNPRLVFLDELTTGLDPQARHVIWELVKEIQQRGKTILLTTHFMEEAEYLCDRIAIMDYGRVVALDTPANLINNLGADERVIFHTDQPLPQGFTSGLNHETMVTVDGSKVTVSGNKREGGQLVGQVVSALTAQGIAFRDLRTEQPNLEDVFLKLTGRALRE